MNQELASVSSLPLPVAMMVPFGISTIDVRKDTEPSPSSCSGAQYFDNLQIFGLESRVPAITRSSPILAIARGSPSIGIHPQLRPESEETNNSNSVPDDDRPKNASGLNNAAIVAPTDSN